MKLVMTPQVSVRRAARRKITYEFCSSQSICQLSSTIPSYYRSVPSSAPRLFSTTSRRYKVTAKPTASEFDSLISHKIRLLMRQIPHPVAIITAYSSSSSSPSTQPIPRGMTVSSFNTVTLHPKPIITFNVRQPSETLSALQSSGRFLVHLLAPTSSMARLARNFSMGNANLEMDQFEFVDHVSDVDTNTQQTLFDNNDMTDTSILPRLIRRRDKESQITHNESAQNETLDTKKDIEESETNDFTFCLECNYLPDKSVQVYDHMIVLGNVERVISSATAAVSKSDLDVKLKELRHQKDDFCLMYADTRFWTMGEEV